MLIQVQKDYTSPFYSKYKKVVINGEKLPKFYNNHGQSININHTICLIEVNLATKSQGNALNYCNEQN